MFIVDFGANLIDISYLVYLIILFTVQYSLKSIGLKALKVWIDI